MAKNTPNTSAGKQLTDAEKAEAAKLAEQLATEEKAKAGDAAAAGSKSSALGPMARQEIRYRKKTYAPGEHLPADIEDEALIDLRRLGAI